MAQDWNIKGDYVEARNCAVACQCIWLEPPDGNVCTVARECLTLLPDRPTTMQAPFHRDFDLQRIPIVTIITYGITLIAWLAIIRRWLPMPRSVPGLTMSDPGAPEAMELSNGFTGVGLYLIMWGVMMIAMMYPSSVPLFRMSYKTLDGTTKAGKGVRVSAFMGTYALVWCFTGIIPLIVNAVVPIATIANEQTTLLIGGHW